MNVLSKAGIFLVLSVCFLVFGTLTSASAAPKLLSPIAGSTLPGSTATFTWTANGESLTDWSLRIGTKQGDSSLYNSGNLPSGTLAQTAAGIPTNGTTVWVRLQWRYTNGLWSSTDVQYTTKAVSGGTSTSSSTTVSSASASTTSNNGSGRPALLTPSAGSTLPGSTATFTWTANGAALSVWSLRIGTKQGDSSLYNSGNLPSGTLAQTAAGIPTNGTTVWVRLQWQYTNGAWSSTDVQYTTGAGSGSTSSSNPSPTSTSSSSTPTSASASSTTSNNGSGRPALLTPSAGSTLPGSTASFTWTANGAALSVWSLRIGTKQGDSSLYNSGNLPSGTLGRTASGIPTNGTTVWVRLQWQYTNGAWSSTDVQYTTGAASGSTSSSSPSPTSTSSSSSASASTTSNDGSGRPALLTPSAGSTLPGSTATFTWTANGATLTDWSLRVGLSAGDSDVYNSGNLPSGTLARTVSGLPTNGLPVWVRLQWRYTDGSWSSTDVQYKGGSTTGGTSTSSPSPTPSTPTPPSPTNPSTSPSGSAFYVSTSGNDTNPGTQSAPFRTIKRGLGVLKSGNTLFIRGGTYSEQLYSWNGTHFPSGNSWSSPITIAAFNGETVNLVGNIDISLASPAIQYLIFDGLRINANGHETGIVLTGNAHHIRFRNGEVKNARRWGIVTNYHNAPSPGDTFHEFINMDVHHNGVTKNVDHGFYIKTSRNLIDGCHIHDNVAWGIHNFAGDSGEPKANNNTYRNNLIHHNGINYSQGGGITFGSGDNNIAYNNVVWRNYTGINVHSYRNPVNSGVFHNTIYGNTGYGILIEPGSQGADVINNISYGNYVNMDNRGSGTSISNNLTAEPSFKNAGGGDFHLQSGSTAIDTGTTLSAVPTDLEGKRRPQGNRSDIGAYEW